jgi:glutathione S-transferase
VADNNGYGLKVFAFLRLAGLPFVHEHIFDASPAPRGQLPYIVDDGEVIGDSEVILAHLTAKHQLKVDAALGEDERRLSVLVSRLLDDLYWVMSYSRWKDELLAAISGGVAARASERDRSSIGQSASVQFPALSFSGHRPICTG